MGEVGQVWVYRSGNMGWNPYNRGLIIAKSKHLDEYRYVLFYSVLNLPETEVIWEQSLVSVQL